MYRDKSLLPTQAIRLAALGSLANAPKRYGDLASEIRHFTGALIGPSLELLGTSLELLRFEGLITPAEGGQGIEDNALMTLTDSGRLLMRELLTAPLKTPLNDLGRVVMVLQLRFLHLLSAEDRAQVLDMLIDTTEGDLARLHDLRRRHQDEPGHMAGLLDLDIHAAEDRLAWFQQLRLVG